MLFHVLTAREYVESLEGCEGLADRLAHSSQTGQDEVLKLSVNIKMLHFSSEHAKFWPDVCQIQHLFKS